MPEHNGLKEDWSPYTNVYSNPPFGRSYLHEACNSLCIPRRVKRGKNEITEYVCTRCESVLERLNVEASSIADWVRKMLGAHRLGSNVIGLIPAATGTKHYQQCVLKNADAVCFPDGRLSFSGRPSEGKKGEVAPMDVCLPYWGNDAERFARKFSALGEVIRLDRSRGEQTKPVYMGVDWSKSALYTGQLDAVGTAGGKATVSVP